MTLDPIDVGPSSSGSSTYRSYGPFTTEKMYHLIPDANLLVVVPPAKNRLILKHLDIKAALDNSGVDYLFVASSPLTATKKGGAYHYEPAVLSKRGGVRFKLESGPKDMRMLADGKVLWAVPPDFEGNTASVILLVSDASGQEIYHTFTIRVE